MTCGAEAFRTHQLLSVNMAKPILSRASQDAWAFRRTVITKSVFAGIRGLPRQPSCEGLTIICCPAFTAALLIARHRAAPLGAGLGRLAAILLKERGRRMSTGPWFRVLLPRASARQQKPQSIALTISSVIFFASASSIIVWSMKKSGLSTPA